MDATISGTVQVDLRHSQVAAAHSQQNLKVHHQHFDTRRRHCRKSDKEFLIRTAITNQVHKTVN